MSHNEGHPAPDARPDDEHDVDGLPVEGDHSQPDEGQVEAPAEEAAPAPELSPEEAALARVAELEDKIKRQEAEFVNETKRMRTNEERARKFAIEKVVEELLPVVDALDGARKSVGDDESASGVREGLSLVEKQLTTVLERHGVKEIDALGQPFDPALHQAMMMVDHPEFEPQHVCEVLRAGYELNGRVVRAAEVLVVKTPPADETPAEGEDA